MTDSNAPKFTISDNVPLAPSRRAGAGRTELYPWVGMNVGDSFFVPGKTQIGVHGPSKRYGYSFATRRVTERSVFGVRVWRVK